MVQNKQHCKVILILLTKSFTPRGKKEEEEEEELCVNYIVGNKEKHN